MLNLQTFSAATIPTFVLVTLPAVGVASHWCDKPEITQVHSAVCYEGATMKGGPCEVHFQGACLQQFEDTDESTKYRVMIADGDGVLKQAVPFPSMVAEATDLHYRLEPAIVDCGTFAWSTLDPNIENVIEDRLIKLQKKVRWSGRGSKWMDVDSKLVTFTCIPYIPPP